MEHCCEVLVVLPARSLFPATAKKEIAAQITCAARTDADLQDKMRHHCEGIVDLVDAFVSGDWKDDDSELVDIDLTAKESIKYLSDILIDMTLARKSHVLVLRRLGVHLHHNSDVEDDADEWEA